MQEQLREIYSKNRIGSLILDYYTQRSGLDLDKKLDILRQNKQQFQNHEDATFYGFALAKILEALVEQDEIDDWLPLPLNREFDWLNVDFIIKSNGKLVPIKFAGRHDDATKKRRRIESRFGSREIIPVINLRTRSNNPKKLSDIRVKILDEVEKYDNITYLL